MFTLKHSPTSVMEKPLRTGVVKRNRASRCLTRRDLRVEADILERMGIEPSGFQFRRSGVKKPFHQTSCPGEWRLFTVRAIQNGEETLFTNQGARTCSEARDKVIAVFQVKVLEVRQQTRSLGLEEADLWWDRIIT